MEEEVEDALGPVADLLDVDLEDVLLELARLVDELLEQFDDGVDDVLVGVVEQREEDLQVLAQEAVVVLLAGVLVTANFILHDHFHQFLLSHD